MNYVVDAGVAFKWFVKEPLRPQALHLLDADRLLQAPDLILAEMAEIARLKLQRSEIVLAQAQEAIHQAPMFFERLVPVQELHERAFELSLKLQRPLAICLYLACAEVLKATLITADRTLTELQDDSLTFPVLHLSALPAAAA
ncbi:MAG: putative nucleic acid-binding protein contains domain [Alphaproteobacteria bacterium]|jgi:predicted nucleic acid-binding protein|nr:putative nucleic acid-binding protein contains domain [Alphaproteobacteria bacterium]